MRKSNDSGNFEDIVNTYNSVTIAPQTNPTYGTQPRDSKDQQQPTQTNVKFSRSEHQNQMVTAEDLDESKNYTGSPKQWQKSNKVHIQTNDSKTTNDKNQAGNMKRWRNAAQDVMKKRLDNENTSLVIKHAETDLSRLSSLASKHPEQTELIRFSSLATKHAEQTDVRTLSSMNLLDQTEENLIDSKAQFQPEQKLAKSGKWMRKNSGQNLIEKEEVRNKSYDFQGLAKSKDSASLLKSMSFNVDISKLYTVLASRYSNQANPYCPVQLKVNDKQLIAHYGGQYLVQLWNQDGELVYQRIRKQPISNRNMIGDHFIFQEDESMRPIDVFVRQDQYKVVKIIGKDCIKQVTIEIEEDNLDDPNAEPSPIEHICCILEKTNANSKFKSTFLVIADNRTVSYIDLTQQLNQKTWTRSASRLMSIAEIQEKEAKNPTGPTISIKRSKMHKTVMQNGWKIHQIQEIQPKGECALVCEDISKSQLVFFHLKDLTENEAIFQPLASHISDYRDDGIEYDSIVDYHSLMCYQQKLEAYKQSGIALRKSGSIDFYYDFRLVETRPAIPHQRIYTAIDQDFNNIHFKCYQKSADVEKVVLYSCQTSWKQRVGILSSQVRSEETIEAIKARLQNYIQSLEDENLSMSVSMGRLDNAVNNADIKALLQIDAETFCDGLHLKVSGFLQLYSSFINAGRKFFLAHNRFVSIFDLAENKWTSHDIFSDTVRQIFRNRKITKGGIGRTYDIGVLVGNSTFRFYEFQEHGKISLTNTNVIEMEGKIRDFQQDQQNDTGFYFTEISSEGALSLNESWSSHSSDEGCVKLHVLVDKQISEISPMENAKFMKEHQKLSIAMLFDESTPSQKFNIILDSKSNDNSLIQEQLQLELREDIEGQIVVDKEVQTQIDQGLIFKKIEGVGQQQDKETMLGEIKYQNCVVKITSKHIILLNDDMEIKQVFENRNVCNFINADKIWLYTLNNRRVSYDNKLKKQSGMACDAGLHVYDLSRLSDGTIEVHKLSNALGGANIFIDYDVGTQTISFIKSYSQIVMMPLPHRNTMNFFGMGDKKDYLIWRQQDGTFTALDKKFQITMWSTVTGKIIKTQSGEIENEKAKAEYEETPRQKHSTFADLHIPVKFVRDQDSKQQTEADDSHSYSHQRTKFELYQANSKDHTYMGNWNNFEKWSVSLIVSQKGKQARKPQQNPEKQPSRDRKAAQLVDNYVAFDKKSIMIPHQAQPDCKIHKFKVLKMGNADFIGKNTRRKDQSSIKILFGDKIQEIQWSEVFSFYFLTHNNPEKRPFIYLSMELDKMLVQTANDFSAHIYSHTGVNEANEVDWKILYQIQRYPIILKGVSTANFLFSPSFERFIDIDFDHAEFVIKQSKDQEVVGRIPAGMVSISFKGRNKSEDAISALASRIRFHSENEIQIYTKEGLDCILNYINQNVESAVAIDNFDIDDFSHPHAILEQNPLEYKDTVHRLMKTCNQIKQQRAHFTSRLKRKEPKLTENEFNEKVVKMTYENMFSVDFSNQDCFALELSFTMLDWIILERVIIDKTFDFSNVDEKQLLQMCFNIFPRIKSVFHHLAENPHVCDLNVIQRLFDSANKGIEMFGGKKVTLPIFKDDENETPMDACLNDAKTFNSKLVSFLFANTKGYPLLHSSHILQHAVCQAIKMDVTGIADYIEARMITSPQICTKKMMANELYEHKKQIATGHEYAIEEFPIWVDKARVERELFDPKGFPKKLRLCFFDIPNISDMSVESDDFFNALAECNHLDLFNITIIRILINKAWSELRYFFYLFLMLPYLLLLFSYSFWQNYVIVDVDQQSLFQTVESQHLWGEYVCYLILLMCSIIISQEVYQFTQDPYRYVTSVWNFLDMTPLGSAAFGPTIFLMGYRLETYSEVLRRDGNLTIGTQPDEIVDEYPLLRKVRAWSQIVASMLLWMKILYFLRTQEKFAYLIRMIIEVAKNIFTFIVVMTVSVIAFTEATYSLSTNEFTDEPVLKNFSNAFRFTFFNAMGEFTMEGFEDNETAWILFFLLTMSNLIVMLNMLIAIISDTYRKVASTQEEFALKELAGVISDLRDFAFFRKLVTIKDPRNYLFIAINEETQKDDNDVNIYEINDKVNEVMQAVQKVDQRVENMAILQLELVQSQASKLEEDKRRQESKESPQTTIKRTKLKLKETDLL